MWIYNLSQRFSQIVNLYGKEPALVFPDRVVTYSELDHYANRIANFLTDKKIKKSEVICISSYKCTETFALLIGCWKLGITYSFVDRLSPINRLSRILETCKPKLVVGDNDFIKIINDNYDMQSLSYSDLCEASRNNSKNFTPETNLESTVIAYIMFTSGSTGNPNGVAISHGNLLHFVEWAKEEYNITNSDILSGANSHFFDNSVFDIYASLLNGASLCPLSRDDVKNPNKLITYLDEKKVSIWFSVPSLLIYLLNLNSITVGCLPQLRKIIFGGEGFPKNKLKELFDIFHTKTNLYNVYGPTECTCICSSYLISEKDFAEDNMNKLSPLGHLFGNFSYLIVDDELKAVEKGEIGELALGGDHVGKGYYGNLEKSKQKYVQNPLHNNFNDVFYLTGDLVRWNPNDGLVYFCGRKDSQVKFMGYRIELGEIEAAMASIPEVKESAVIYGKKNAEWQILCFVSAKLDTAELKKKLSNSLPSYMIPRKFIHMEVLPKNSNGKIDRKTLSGEYCDEI